MTHNGVMVLAVPGSGTWHVAGDSDKDTLPSLCGAIELYASPNKDGEPVQFTRDGVACYVEPFDNSMKVCGRCLAAAYHKGWLQVVSVKGATK